MAAVTRKLTDHIVLLLLFTYATTEYAKICINFFLNTAYSI